MKKLKAKHIISAAFLVCIGIFMVAVLFRFFGSQFLGLNFDSQLSTEQDSGEAADKYNWAADYPFSPSQPQFTFKAEEPQNEQKAESVTLFSKIQQIAESVEYKIDYYTTKLLWGRMKFVELNAAFNRAVGMNIVSGTDSVIVMRNGYLTYQSYETDVSYAAQSTTFLRDFLDKKGINLLYVQYPAKENKFDNQLPSGVEDYYNSNADALLKSLNKNGVSTLDLRDALNREMDYYSCFFRTDHHWKPETGVWAAGKIAEVLNKTCGYSINTDVGNLNNYNIKVYENYCLGSQGKKVTLKYTDPEDISLITPKQETSFTVVYDTDDPISGEFKETLVDTSRLDRIDYYETSTYATYLFGDNALTRIKNNKITNGKRLLVIADSFAKCNIPYLAGQVEFIDVLDARYFNGSIINYIEKTSPDTVIVAYNPSSINDSSSVSGTFNFN